MSDEEPDAAGSESWLKSVQITRALGLPATSVLGVLHLVKGWKRGEFSADDIQSVVEVLVYVVLMVYYPIHAAYVWISRRVKAGNDPSSNAPRITPPAIITATIKRLTK